MTFSKTIVRRVLAMLFIPFAIAACTPTEPEVSRTNIQYPFTVRTVDVKIAPNAPEGRFKEDLALRENARSVIEKTLEQRFRIVPGGSTKARALVTLTTMRLKVAGARTFGGSNAIYGDIKILDSKGRVLAHNPNVRHFDQAKQTSVLVNGNPLIGIVISLARNAQNEEVGKDLQFAIAGFSEEAVDWLAKGKGAPVAQKPATQKTVAAPTETSAASVAKPVAPKKTSRLQAGSCLTRVWDFRKNAYICENDPKASKGRGELVGVSTALAADRAKTQNAAAAEKPKEKRVWNGTCFKVWDPQINNYVCED